MMNHELDTTGTTSGPRTDPHAPSQFDPSQYAVICYLDNRPPEYFCGWDSSEGEWKHAYELWQAEMLQVLGADWRAKSCRCIHCGNGSVRWITAVRHLPTGDVLVFGATCTERLKFANKVQFQLARLHKLNEARKVRLTIVLKRNEFVAANPEVQEALRVIGEPVHANNRFAKDVLSKLDQWGSLSEKQVAAVTRSLAQDHERAVQLVEEKGPAPTGRVAVTGTVLSTKWQDSDYGGSLKMLVKLANNAKVWCTVPSAVTVDRGDTITVTATWEPSRDDASFAFGKRPIVSEVVPAVFQEIADAKR